jgi:hypothetical protein
MKNRNLNDFAQRLLRTKHTLCTFIVVEVNKDVFGLKGSSRIVISRILTKALLAIRMIIKIGIR